MVPSGMEPSGRQLPTARVAVEEREGGRERGGREEEGGGRKREGGESE